MRFFDKQWRLSAFLLFSFVGTVYASSDVSADLFTTDGSTKLGFIDSGSTEVGSIDSNGNGTFNSMTLTGDAKGVILNQETLQSGTTIYVSSGTVENVLRVDDQLDATGIICRDYSQSSVSNTTTETTVFSCTIPGDIMSTNRALRIVLHGTWVNNTGSSRSLQIRAKLGGSTILDSQATLNTCTGGNVFTELFIVNNDSASSQKGAYDTRLHCDTGLNPFVFAANGTGTVDTSSDQTLELTIQHGFASASLTYSKEGVDVCLE